MFISPQIINPDFGLYRYFKVASSLLRNSLTFPEGALYKLNIIRWNILVTNRIAHISNSCALQRWDGRSAGIVRLRTKGHGVGFLFYSDENYQFYWNVALSQQKYTLISSVGLFGRNANPTGNHPFVKYSSSCSTIRRSLKHNTWRFVLSVSKESTKTSLLLQS
jgi:hypothetical protein